MSVAAHAQAHPKYVSHPPRAPLKSPLHARAPNARATAVRFKSQNFTILAKVYLTVKKVPPHAGLKIKNIFFHKFIKLSFLVKNKIIIFSISWKKIIIFLVHI